MKEFCSKIREELKDFGAQLKRSLKEVLKPTLKSIVEFSLEAKIGLCIIFALFLSYIFISYLPLGFTLENYLSNLQVISDFYVLFFIPYSYYLFTKIPEGYKSVLSPILTIFKVKGKKEYLNEIDNPKSIRFVFPAFFAISCFTVSFLFLNISADKGFILWGAYKSNFNPSCLFYARLYALIVSSMISWLGFVGFYTIVRYWTISKQISNLKNTKRQIFLAKNIIFLHLKFKDVFRYHLQKTFQVNMLCFSLFAIGVMYSSLFGFWEAGWAYMSIGGFLSFLILFRYIATGKKLKEIIECKKKRALRTIQRKIHKFNLDHQKTDEKYFLQKSYTNIKQLSLVKKVPPTNIAILVSFLSLIIISTNIFIPNAEDIYKITIFYIAISLLIYLTIYYKIKLSD